MKKELIEPTSGFRYKQHFRPMVVGVLGEHLTRQIEESVEQDYPGDIERLVMYTSTLWKVRCNFAHTNIASNVVTQQTFEAPSWSQNQYRLISKILPRYEKAAVRIAAAL